MDANPIRLNQLATLRGVTPKRRNVKRKAEYCCKKCGLAKTMSTGHTQYKGHWYCPNDINLPPPDEWKADVTDRFKKVKKAITTYDIFILKSVLK